MISEAGVLPGHMCLKKLDAYLEEISFFLSERAE